MARIHDLGWWYWCVTVGLLGAGLFGWPAGIYGAILLCAVQIGPRFTTARSLTARTSGPNLIPHPADAITQLQIY